MTPKTYYSFDDYVKDYPEGERFRNWITGLTWSKAKGHRSDNNLKSSGPTRETVLIPTYPNWNGLPGDYFWAYLVEWENTFAIRVNDNDDMSVVKEYETEVEALKMLNDLPTHAPFTMKELVVVFGFKWD